MSARTQDHAVLSVRTSVYLYSKALAILMLRRGGDVCPIHGPEQHLMFDTEAGLSKRERQDGTRLECDYTAGQGSPGQRGMRTALSLDAPELQAAVCLDSATLHPASCPNRDLKRMNAKGGSEY